MPASFSLLWLGQQEEIPQHQRGLMAVVTFIGGFSVEVQQVQRPDIDVVPRC